MSVNPITGLKNIIRPPKPPVNPPVTPPAPVNLVRVKVDDGHAQLAASSGSLLLDWYALTATASLDGGVLVFTLPDGAPMGWGAQLHTTVTGFQDANQRIVLASDINVTVQKVVTLKPLTINGHVFEAGGPFTAIECSDFKLLKLYLEDGEAAILPVLEQRRSLGFNMVRVFGMCDLMWKLNPAAVPLFYSRLKLFLQFVNAHRLYVEFSVFPDCAIVMPDRGEQETHWARVIDAVRGTLTLLERQNEGDQGPNAIENTFARPVGVLASNGSNGSQATPIRPWWDYETFHTNDAPEFWRKVGHNAMELSDGAETITASHVPILANENTRWDHDGNDQHAFDAAAGAALLCAGSCCHTPSGKESTIWQGDELRWAQQWANGAKSVDLTQQHFSYQHRADLEGPSDLRVYQRGSAIVRIRK